MRARRHLRGVPGAGVVRARHRRRRARDRRVAPARRPAGRAAGAARPAREEVEVVMEFPPRFPERFNMARWFLDERMVEGRGARTAVIDDRGSWSYADV